MDLDSDCLAAGPGGLPGAFGIIGGPISRTGLVLLFRMFIQGKIQNALGKPSG